LELPRAGLAILEDDLGAGDVGGHQIRGELDAAEIERQAAGERLYQQRLGQAGDPFENAVAAGEDAHQQLLDDRVLPDDDGADLIADLLLGGVELFEGGQVRRTVVGDRFRQGGLPLVTFVARVFQPVRVSLFGDARVGNPCYGR